MCDPALGIEVEPHCVGGPGVLDLSLLLHGLALITPVLARNAIRGQVFGHEVPSNLKG